MLKEEFSLNKSEILIFMLCKFNFEGAIFIEHFLKKVLWNVFFVGTIFENILINA